MHLLLLVWNLNLHLHWLYTNNLNTPGVTGADCFTKKVCCRLVVTCWSLFMPEQLQPLCCSSSTAAKSSTTSVSVHNKQSFSHALTPPHSLKLFSFTFSHTALHSRLIVLDRRWTRTSHGMAKPKSGGFMGLRPDPNACVLNTLSHC